MTDAYLPPSEFLQAIVRDEVTLSGSEEAQINLHRLIAMTKDADPENRDWAALLLAQEDVDTDEVRRALVRAAQDESAVVRAEAVLGLALRDKSVALPFLRNELAGDAVALPIFEAAALVADASLAEDLRAFASRSGDATVDKAAEEALRACEAAR
jgi:hypothetical protein